MRCKYCGGALITEREPITNDIEHKCIMCGRRMEMDEEKGMKKCSKCGKEKPATTDFYSVNNATGDGLEPSCKECRKKYGKEYRLKKREAMKPERKTTRPRSIPQVKPSNTETNIALTPASPQEIIRALEKGIAVQIINVIKEKFGI